MYTNRNELEDMLQEHVKTTVENDYGTNDYRTAVFDTIQKGVSYHSNLIVLVFSNHCIFGKV